MLGDILYELNDIKIISQRVIEDPNRIRIESTISASSDFRGTEITETTTFWTTPTNNNNNILYGEANGVLITTRDRHGLATFHGRGLTFKLDNGRIKDRGYRIYSTDGPASEANKL